MSAPEVRNFEKGQKMFVFLVHVLSLVVQQPCQPDTLLANSPSCDWCFMNVIVICAAHFTYCIAHKSRSAEKPRNPLPVASCLKALSNFLSPEQNRPCDCSSVGPVQSPVEVRCQIASSADVYASCRLNIERAPGKQWSNAVTVA